jgi:hypothetical protein
MKINAMIRSVILCTTLVMLSSCASLFSPTKNIQVKAVDSTTQKDLDDVICKVTDGSGKFYKLANNPGAVKVQKSSTNLLIVCKKTGYKQLSVFVGEDFDNITPINPMLWGGFNLDGEIKNKKYPTHYLILMQQSTLSQ